MRILITGGTTFVSKYSAKYFMEKGHEVYVLNRNSKPQLEGVKLIESDRHNIGDTLKNLYFDAVLDITAYDASDIIDLLNSLGNFGQYIMISSSAVYPEYEKQPFTEETPIGANKFWGDYGTDKIEAEKALLERVRDAYILRPPYIYGPMNNVYREAMIFDCAIADRKFYLPQEGELKLQFFHVDDLCKLMEIIINTKPENHILNVGNVETISVKKWIEMCYNIYNKIPEFVNVPEEIGQRKYFCFSNYEYYLDVTKQKNLLPETIDFETGLKECAEWYKDNKDELRRRPYLEFIDEELGNI